jgi:hypothetical protein
MALRHVYNVSGNISVGDVIPAYGEVLDEVNKAMHGFGFPEKIIARADTKLLEVSSDRILMPEELKKLLDTFKQRLPTIPLFKSATNLNITYGGTKDEDEN